MTTGFSIKDNLERKAADLEGHRLLVVQPLDDREGRKADMVTPVVAADPVGADYG